MSSLASDDAVATTTPPTSTTAAVVGVTGSDSPTSVSNKYIHHMRDPEDFIGKGQFGLVWKAKTRAPPQTTVAVKIIKFSHLKKDQVGRINKEIEIMRMIMNEYTNGNPNIVRLYDVERKEGEVSLFMEFCPGGDLTQLIDRKGVLTTQTASRFLRNISNGLQFLHSLNIIHRDLKPDNLLLTTSDPETAVVKLADFGLARELEQTDLAQTVCGTRLFMAPEVLKAWMHHEKVEYTDSVDLFSAGAILYNMVTGRLEPECFYKRIIRGDAPNLSMLPPHIESDCKDVLVKLLKVDPAERITHEDLLAHPFLQPPVPSMDEDDKCAADKDKRADQKTEKECVTTHDQATEKVGGGCQAGGKPKAKANVLSKTEDDLSDEWDVVDMNEDEKISSLKHAALPPDEAMMEKNIKETARNLMNDLRKSVGLSPKACSNSSDQGSSGLAKSFTDKKKPSPSRLNSQEILTRRNRELEERARKAEERATEAEKAKDMLAREKESVEDELDTLKHTTLLKDADALMVARSSSNNSNSDSPPKAGSHSPFRGSPLRKSSVVVECARRGVDDEELLSASPLKIPSPNMKPLSSSVTSMDDMLVEGDFRPAMSGAFDGMDQLDDVVEGSVMQARFLDEHVVGDKKPESPMVLLESPPKQSGGGGHGSDGNKMDANDSFASLGGGGGAANAGAQWNVTFKTFEENDLVMFIKHPHHKDVYNAFHHDDGHPIFLDMEALPAFRRAYCGSEEDRDGDNKDLPDLLFGNILLVQKDLEATRKYNPFALNGGERFSMIVAEPVLNVEEIAAIKENRRNGGNKSAAVGGRQEDRTKSTLAFTFATDKVNLGTTNLFVAREVDGYDKGIYVMVRHETEYDVPYFLSKDCIAAMAERGNSPPNYLLGRCIEIENRVAGMNDEWGLTESEEYGLVTAEILP